MAQPNQKASSKTMSLDFCEGKIQHRVGGSIRRRLVRIGFGMIAPRYMVET